MLSSNARSRCRWALALFFVVAGIGHFINPGFYVSIVPEMLPAPLALVYISGVFEILGGLGVLVRKTRRFSGWGLIALLVAVFPANIKMLNDHLHDPRTWFVIGLVVRLPLQVVFGVIIERLTRFD